MVTPSDSANAQSAHVPPLPTMRQALPYRAFLRVRARAHALWPTGSAHRWHGVRILAYHAVNDDPMDVLAIPPRRLGQHLDTVRTSGIEIIHMRDVYARLTTHPDERAVVIVFDDGYRDMLTNALPVLESRGVPATVFVSDKIVSGEARCSWYPCPPAFMNWDECHRLASSGLVDIQPHGSRHLNLTRLDDDDARNEIIGCVDRLAAEGFPTHTYCYSGGFHGPRERSIVAACPGLQGAVSTAAGVNGPSTDRTSLRRTMIVGNERPAELRAILEGNLDRPSLIARSREAARRSWAIRG
jgi:peptidoglycan/xylan/chitin deacetylase (PgdA/CDA1 family)